MQSSIASRALASALALLAFAAPGHAQDADFSLDALLARFAAVERVSCRFEEEKTIALLRTPIRSAGTIEYTRPGRLVRRVERPSAQEMRLEGDTLRMIEGGRTETIDLRSQPIVRSFVDGIVQLLRGDRAALERVYRVEARATPSGWAITLRPRSAPLDRFLREMTMEGDGTALRSMTMLEVSGDSTRTTFRY